MTRTLSRFGWILSMIISTTFVISAQNGIIRGNVFDSETGQAIPFATIALDAGNRLVNTDYDGFFSFSKVSPGEHSINVKFTSYDSLQLTINVKPGGIIYKKIYLQPSNIELQGVEISGARDQARNDVQVSKLTVTTKEIKQLPSMGGEPDIAQYLPVLPGVISTGDQGGQIFIRGGSPVQNRIMLDGLTIVNPFHSIGFFSVFETELIRNVDVFTGGFNSEHGGRISAVVDIHTRDGSSKKLSGLVSGSPFMLKTILEGPIVRGSSDKASNISYILGAKYGLINKTGKSLYEYASDANGLPYGFQDFYGKVSFAAGTGSKVNIFGFNFNDDVDYPGITGFNTSISGGALQYNLIPSSSNTIINGIVGFSKYGTKQITADNKERTSNLGGFNAKVDFSNYGRNNRFTYGLEANILKTEFSFVNYRNYKYIQSDNTTEVSAYMKYYQKVGNLILEPGLRYTYYASLSESQVEPRLGLKYNITDHIRLKGAGGFYSQNLVSSVSEQDIVNLFVGFLSGPEETVYKPASKTPSDSKLQKSWHAIAGVELDITEQLSLDIEAYYKNNSQLIALNRFKQLEGDPNFLTETGNAKGIDLLVKYQLKNIYLWATYSRSYVTRFDGYQEYPPHFDRRNNINLLASYKFGSKNSWEAGVRWNYGTGFPFTLTQGFYTNYDISQGGITTDVLGENGTDIGVIYSDKRNSGRLPDYHRLDFSLKKTFNFSRYSSLDVTGSVTNVYDRKNIFYFDRVKYSRVNQLPILPSLTVAYHF